MVREGKVRPCSRRRLVNAFADKDDPCVMQEFRIQNNHGQTQTNTDKI
jgi:hypothetical protein